MTQLAPFVFVLAFAGVLGLVGWLVADTVRRNRAPADPAARADLARLAAAKGWMFTPRDDGYLRRFTGYPFGRGGRLRPALDLVTGVHRGRTFACFRFAPPRSAPGGDAVAAVDQARVVAVALPAAVPAVVVAGARNEPWARRYAVGDEVFDRAFTVGTDDEPFAGRVLTEPVRRWLLANPPPGSLRLGGGADLIAWQPDTGDFEAHHVEPAVDRLCDLLDRIPADALRNQT